MPCFACLNYTFIGRRYSTYTKNYRRVKKLKITLWIGLLTLTLGATSIAFALVSVALAIKRANIPDLQVVGTGEEKELVMPFR